MEYYEACKTKVCGRNVTSNWLVYPAFKEFLLSKSSKHEYYLRHREEIIARNSIYHKNRKRIDINYKLEYYLLNRMGKALKSCGILNPERSFEAVGCTVPELKRHLESQFQTGMTWTNYGKWHVDHIRPCSSFDLTQKAQQLECFNYSNLQPLWALYNIQKNSTYEVTK